MSDAAEKDFVLVEKALARFYLAKSQHPIQLRQAEQRYLAILAMHFPKVDANRLLTRLYVDYDGYRQSGHDYVLRTHTASSCSLIEPSCPARFYETSAESASHSMSKIGYFSTHPFRMPTSILYTGHWGNLLRDTFKNVVIIIATFVYSTNATKSDEKTSNRHIAQNTAWQIHAFALLGRTRA